MSRPNASLLDGIVFCKSDDIAASENSSDKVKIKRKEKRHKHKKNKSKDPITNTKKKQKRGDRSEKAVQSHSNPPREEWMSMPFEEMACSTRKHRDKEQDSASVDAEKEIDDGIAAGLRDLVTGMPFGYYDPKAKVSGDGRNKGGSATPIIGDGGASWRAKKEKRAKERELIKRNQVQLDASERTDHMYRKATREQHENMDSTHQPSHYSKGNGGKSNERAACVVDKGDRSVQPNHQEQDLNKLAASALRAQMRGDLDLFAKLTHQLNEEEARQRAIHSHSDVSSSSSQDMRRVNRTDRSDRQKDPTLAELVKEERTLGITKAADMDIAHAKNIMRLGNHYKGTEALAGRRRNVSGVDEEDAVDTSLYQPSRDRASSNRNGVTSDFRHNREDDCLYCIHSLRCRKDRIASTGNFTYLKQPATSRSLMPGHCYIVPQQHASSFVAADEQVWEELQRYKKSLRTYFREVHDQAVMFMEQTSSPHRGRHTIVECLPVPHDTASSAPLYFKQELLHADEEWSTHPKILRLSINELKRRVPPQCPYFHIEWSEENGFAHIIENEAKFPRQFGLDIVSGMIELDAVNKCDDELDTSLSLTIVPPVSASKALEFLPRWTEYDWTRTDDSLASKRA